MIPSLYDSFKRLSDGGSVYLISDTHFEYSDCKFMDKDWISPQEQIDIINQYVYKNDTLIHLGDVGNPEWMKQIKGYKLLIMGNHDESKMRFLPYFNEIYEGCLFIGEKLLLSHEPVIVDYALNIHGHDHNGNAYPYEKYPEYHHINLAANIIEYTPVSLKDIIKNNGLSKIKSIHRKTINEAIERKKEKELII